MKSEKVTASEWMIVVLSICVVLVLVWKFPNVSQLIVLTATAWFLLKTFKATDQTMRHTTIAERPYLTLVFDPESDEELITTNGRIENFGRTVALNFRYEMVGCDSNYVQNIEYDLSNELKDKSKKKCERRLLQNN